MKLDTQKVNVTRSAAFQEEFFSIADPAMVLETLRSRMYPNPIKTIVQEISSNGRDANREIGTPDVPIVITLPHSLNNNIFSIRDNGLGITPHRMSNVFIKFCASTKRESDEQTGGYGYGAKTPWAYGDQFTIVSVTPEHLFEDQTGELHEECRVRREYIAYIDETRLGKMALVNEAATLEEQGTTIIIAVKESDTREFQNWVIDRLKYWSVRPVILGNSTFEWPKINKKFEGKDGKWFIAGEQYGISFSFLLIDEIPYPLNPTNANLYESLTKEELKLFHHQLCLVFNTGEIPVVANRDDIDYAKDATKNLIAERFRQAYQELKQICNDKIANAQNLWEANVQFIKVKDHFNLESATWKGIAVNGSAICFLGFGAEQRLFTNDKSELKSRSVDFVTPSSKTLFVLDDDPDQTIRPSRARVAMIFERHPDLDSVFVVRLLNRQMVLDAIPDKAKKDEARQKLDKAFKELQETGHFDLFEPTLLSTFEKVPRLPRAKRFASVTKAYRYNHRNFPSWVAINAEDIEADAYYVLTSHRNPIVFGQVMDNAVFENMIDEVFPDGVTLYGIPARFEKIVEGELEPLDKIFKKKQLEIAAEMETTLFPDKSFTSYQAKEIFDRSLLPALKNVIKTYLPNTSLLSELIATSTLLDEQLAIWHKLCNRALRFNVSPKQQLDKTVGLKLKTLADTIRKRYPLLVYLSHWALNDDSNSPAILVDYLNMCDANLQKGVA